MFIVEINITGRGIIKITNLLLDYNWTISCVGRVIPSLKDKIEAIK